MKVCALLACSGSSEYGYRQTTCNSPPHLVVCRPCSPKREQIEFYSLRLSDCFRTEVLSISVNTAFSIVRLRTFAVDATVQCIEATRGTNVYEALMLDWVIHLRRFLKQAPG